MQAGWIAANAIGTVTSTEPVKHQAAGATDVADSFLAPDTSANGVDIFTATTTNLSVNTVSAPLNADIAPAVTIADGAMAEIDGASAQSVTFAGTTGTLKIDHSLTYAGKISGLAGSDGVDLADVSYEPVRQRSFPAIATAARSRLPTGSIRHTSPCSETT